MILTELLYVAMLPLACAAAVALLARSMRLASPITWTTSIAFAYVAGQLALTSRTSDILASLIHPREAADWLPHAVLCALVITLLATRLPSRWRHWALLPAIALTIGLPLRLLAGSTYDLHWTLFEKFAYLALLSATLGITWLALASPDDTDHPQLRPILLIVVGAAAAVAVSLSGVFVYGELCGVVAAALTGTLLTSRAPHVAGAAGVITFSLGSIILLSCFYAELTPTNAALLFLAIVVAAGPMPAFLSPRPAWLKSTLRVVLTLVPLAIVLGQTLAATQAQTTAAPYAF